MREWRKDHPLNAEQRRKDNCRSYANAYKKRGLLKPRPCETCGFFVTEMHHDDYDKPLEVRWLCRKCHLAFHRAQKTEQDQMSNMKLTIKRAVHR